MDRPSTVPDRTDALLRSRSNLKLDLKNENDKNRLLELVATADALIEGFRPGTLERLGLGPDVLLARNPHLVIGRMTGWGQSGPYSKAAGHDINYIALTGALNAIGPAEKPVPPLSLVGDFGGGGMLLALSVTAALLHAKLNGEGQVIDCSMCDGAGILMTPFYAYMAAGWWRDQRASNIVDGGAHFYNVYETADGKFISIGSIEPQFYAILLDRLGLAGDPEFEDQNNEAKWPDLRRRLAEIFRSKTSRRLGCDLRSLGCLLCACAQPDRGTPSPDGARTR